MKWLLKFLNRDLQFILSRKLGKRNFAFSDPRSIIDESSKLLSESSLSILNFASQKTNLPICKEIPIFKPNLLPEDVKIHMFWEKGFAPLLIGNQVVGVVSSNPSLLKNLPKSLQKLPIYISSWADISQCLYASEANHRTENCQSEEKLATALLGVIIEEAKAANASRILLNLNCPDAQYIFEFKNGDMARGSIASDGSKALSGYLRYQNLTELNVLLPSKNISEQFKIKLSEVGAEIILNDDTDKYPASNVVEFPTPKVTKRSSLIFLVDDDKSFLTVTERYLMQHGFTAKSFLNAQECLDFLSRTPSLPFVLITDMHMQDSTGAELIKKIKETVQISEIPIIALSGDETGSTELSLLESGAEYVVMKRGDPRILLHLIKRFASKSDFKKVMP